MDNLIRERVLSCAEYIISQNATLRKTAEKFMIGKSTVHSDMNKRLPLIDYGLYLKVKKILGINLMERHIRGGESTKKKYASQ